MEEPKSTIVTVPQLVDLALNSPEIGIVNFTIMHSLLHVMVHQLQLTDCSVEFRGSDSDRLQNYIKTAKPGPIIALKEYIIGGETPVIIETPEKGQVDEASPEKQSVTEGASKTVVVVEPSKQDNNQQTTFSVGISQDQYHKLMKDMDDIKEQVKELNDLPGNIGLLEAIRTPTAPVQEMFNLMSMNKKVDAHEITLKKLSTLIEDLILEKKGEGPLVDIIDFNESDMDNLKKQVKKLEEQVIDINKWRKDEQNRPVKTSDAKEQKEAKEVKIPLSHMSTKMDYKVVVPSDNTDTKTRLDALYENLVQMNDTYQENFKDVNIEISNLKEMAMWNTGVVMDDKIKEKTKSKMITPSMPTLFSKISMATGMSQTTQVIPMELSELPKKVKLLEGTLTTTNDMTQILWDERPAKQKLMDMVKETVDILKNLKADREEIEEALQEKADTCMLETLVTKIDFAAVQQDLLHLLDVANQKLQYQENFYQDQITTIYEEINKKMEIGELDELKEQINAKMKIVNDKLKVLLDVKNETEAAGGKMRFVKNLTCLSCDKEVIMRREVDANSFPKAAALPGPKSMGAYLAYELDQMRKQRKCSQNAKSLNLLEHALHSRHDTSKIQTDHICNRYCGGSHTKVTSGQKVTRLGHFLNQWDPDAGGIVDEIIRGTDGKAYKAQADVSKN